MKNRIYLRPLKISDADIAYKWRNNPKIWKYTGNAPYPNIITPEIERNWLSKVLEKSDEKRFAICISESDEYIGNVQLTNVTITNAEFHVFIGETSFWSKGYGKEATLILLEKAFNELLLEEIYLSVNPKNLAATKTYNSIGFTITEEKEEFVKMTIKKNDFK